LSGGVLGVEKSITRKCRFCGMSVHPDWPHDYHSDCLKMELLEKVVKLLDLIIDERENS